MGDYPAGAIPRHQLPNRIILSIVGDGPMFCLKAGQPKTARGPLLPMPDPLKGDEYREAVESQKRRWGRGDL